MVLDTWLLMTLDVDVAAQLLLQAGSEHSQHSTHF